MAPPNPSKVSTENEKTVKVETQGKEAAKGSAPPNPTEVRASKASREVEVRTDIVKAPQINEFYRFKAHRDNEFGMTMSWRVRR